MSKDRELLEALTVEDPWCHSQEGLDDGCHFCGGWDSRCEDARLFIRLHDPRCDWMAAMDYLGKAHPEHEFGKEVV